MKLNESRNAFHAFRRTLQGLGLGLVLVMISALSIQVGPYQLSLMFLPIAIVVLWPTDTSVTWSYWAVFLIGLFMDVVTNGPFGIWALSMLTVFLVLNEYAFEQKTFTGCWMLFAMSVLLCALCLFVIGRVFLSIWVPVLPLALNMAAAFFVFPLVYVLVKLVMKRGRTDVVLSSKT